MDAIYDLRDKLCKELADYGNVDNLSTGTLDTIDKLAHAVKNLDKVIETMEDGDYSGYGGTYGTNMMHSRRSYARGRNARRDGMGRYSSDGYSRTGDVAERLRRMMPEVHDERTRDELERLAARLEQR